MSQTRSGGKENPTASTPPNFPSVAELPTTEPQVILAFHGLMAMSFKRPGSPGSAGFCEVGIHDAAANHDFRIQVFDLGDATPGSKPEPFYTYNFGPAHPSPVDIIRFDAVNTITQDMQFFQPVGFSWGTPTKGRIISDSLDFRLVNNLEGPEFYNRSLEKAPGIFRPRLLVKSGIFVTLVPSKKDFAREARFDHLKLGKIAQIAGAGIYLKPDGVVGLRFGQEELRLPLKSAGNTLYLFLFDNTCPPKVCDFIPDSPIKEKRNDFFEYFKTFKIPEDKEEFELILDQTGGSPGLGLPTGPGKENYGRVAKFLDEDFFKESNNEAPCGPVGFGGGG